MNALEFVQRDDTQIKKGPHHAKFALKNIIYINVHWMTYLILRYKNADYSLMVISAFFNYFFLFIITLEDPPYTYV